MRKLDISAITGTTGMPIKSGTLNHLQLAYQEAIAAVAQGLVGAAYSSSTGYILYGCVNSGSGSSYNISAGAVFYNGEVYLTPSASFTTGGSNVAVGVITTGHYFDATADHVSFTDGSIKDVHVIRTMVFQAGLSGSGAVNFVALADVGKRLCGTIGELKIWNWRFYGGTLSTYFDSTGLGTHPYTLGWAIANGNNSTDDMGGIFAVGYTAADIDYNNPFSDVGGEKKHLLTLAEMPAHSHNIVGAQSHWGVSGDGDIHGRGVTGSDFDTDMAGGSTAHENRPPYRSVLYVQRIA